MFKCPKKASSSPCQTMRISLVFPAALQTINLHQRKSAPKLYSLAGWGGGSWQSNKKQQKSWSISGIALLTSSDLTHDGQINVIVWVQHESSHAEGKRTWLRGQDMLQFRPKLQINLWRDCTWHYVHSTCQVWHSLLCAVYSNICIPWTLPTYFCCLL